MKSIVSGMAAMARRVPWVVIVVTIGLTGGLGFFAGQATVASGNEGFAPESLEIAASERIGDKFGRESSESTLQVLILAEGGDVITVEGLRTAMAAVDAIRQSEVGSNIGDRPERPGAFHYLGIVEQEMLELGLTVDEMSDELVKSIYSEATNGDGVNDAPPDQVSFLSRLVSEDYDSATISASGGMALAFIGAFEGTADEAFNAQVDAEKAMAADLGDIDSELSIRPFSFYLLLTGVDDFTEEVGRLFGMAFVVILLILLMVYWLPPGRGGSWFASGRRTVTDTLITLLTILCAIAWMQGIGYLLEQVGIIDAFSAPTQIVPILLIGLGVDFAIHLTSRYREEVGQGGSVDSAVTKAVGTVGVALALATITTVIGFLTNVFNPVPALKDFGILAAVGIAVAFLLMLTFVPSVRIVADRRAERKGKLPVQSLQKHGDRLLPRIMEKLAVLALRAPVATLVVALLLGGAGYYGFSQLETRFSFTDFLPEDSEYVSTLDLLVSEFGGGFGEQTQVLVEATPAAGLDANAHNALVAANSALADISDVSTIDSPQGRFANAMSPVGLLGQLMAGGPDGTHPDLIAAAQQVELDSDLTVPLGTDITPLYRAMTNIAPEAAERVIYFEGGILDAFLWDITTTAGEDVGDLRPGLDGVFAPVRQTGVSAIATSDNIIGDVIVGELTDSQARSLFITIAVSALVLAMSFLVESRRWFLGVITIAPVGLVVLWTYGLMYATGIPFGPVTATLAALAIGIGVPFTIHIARRFQEDQKAYASLDNALRSTMRHTGGALAGSALTTMAGFGILMTASLVPFRQMGQVTVYAIGLALVAAVVVLPSMLALWDGYHRRRGDERIGSAIAGDVIPTADIIDHN